MRKFTFFLILFAVLLLSPQSLFASDFVVCIDPGHGGPDDGCTGRIYGVKEKDVNLSFGLITYSYLAAYYWWPIITRTEDIDIDRSHRANINKKTCDILEHY